MFERIAVLEGQQSNLTSSPAWTPSPSKTTSTRHEKIQKPASQPIPETAEKPQKTQSRAQRRSAPPSPEKDNLDLELEAMRAQLKSQSDIIRSFQEPKPPKDPRQAQLAELKAKMKEQAEIINALKNASSNADEPEPEGEMAGKDAESNNTGADAVAADDLTAIIMPDGAKAVRP